MATTSIRTIEAIDGTAASTKVATMTRSPLRPTILASSMRPSARFANAEPRRLLHAEDKRGSGKAGGAADREAEADIDRRDRRTQQRRDPLRALLNRRIPPRLFGGLGGAAVSLQAVV